MLINRVGISLQWALNYLLRFLFTTTFMSPTIILSCVIAYSALLFYVVWRTSKNADNESYFIGNKSSKWYLVAYGMIGASLSGVTFMSVPGLLVTGEATLLFTKRVFCQKASPVQAACLQSRSSRVPCPGRTSRTGWRGPRPRAWGRVCRPASCAL